MNIISQLVQFILMRRQVKDIDYNQKAAIICFLVYVSIMTGIATFINQYAAQIADFPIRDVPPIRMAIEALTFIALYYCFFAAQEKKERFVQAATALYGTSALLFIAMLIISPIPGAPLLVVIAFIWNAVCMVRTTIQSLEYSIVRAIFSLLGIALMADIVANFTFPIVLSEQYLKTQGL